MFQRYRGITAGVVIATSAVLVLSGCSSSKKSAGGSSSSSSPSATAGYNAAAAALVPAAVKAKGTLTVAMDATYPPDEFIGTDGKTIQGWDVDFGKALLGELGLQANFVNATFDSIIPRLVSGQYDIGLSSFTDNKKREATVDFVTYFTSGEGFYENASSTKTYSGLDSLCGAKVAVENGTTELDDANAQAKKCKLTVLAFADQNGANLAVSSGRADVGFLDSQVAANVVSKSNGQFKVVGSVFSQAPYGIALPKGNGMAPAVLAALQAMIADGTYTKILTTWGVQSGAISTPVINGATS